MKLLEHAAAKGWLNVLAGKPDEDWEGCNALLHELLHDTIPISIYIRLRRNTAHQAFKHLAKRFRDREPIADPRAKKLATCANEDKRHPSVESPMSENAAAERHAHAEREDPPCTKDLTRGIEDVDDRNVGREDPRTSLEASAKGNSAESAGTTVLLESAPHERQDRPQNSLQATLQRLPFEDEPSECEQEAAESLVTAGRANGTVGMIEPHETVADIDGTALLGGEPAERVCGVDGGDKTERDGQSQLQQAELYCEESHQHNANANGNVPSAHRLPLEGEWDVCASGETSDPNGVESEGCGGGTSGRASVDELETTVECCQQLCMANGDGGRGAESMDTPKESDTLVILSIESEAPNGGGIPRVHLGRTRLRACHADRLGNAADASSCQTDGSTGWTDTLDVSNGAEMADISCNEGAEMYLGSGGAKRVVNATGGVGSQSDTSSGHSGVPSVETHVNRPTNAPGTVSIPRKPRNRQTYLQRLQGSAQTSRMTSGTAWIRQACPRTYQVSKRTREQL